ncbi:MAG: ABC transporter permease, partial [Nitriliruptoraceae bacterium]
HLLLALLVILPYLAVTRGTGVLLHLPGALVAVVLLTVFASGMAMWFAAVNVVFRDLQELFIVIFLVWFYSTPVLYPLALVHAELGPGSVVAQILAVNPMTWLVEAFRAPLYGPVVEVGGTIISGPPAWPSAQSVALATGFAIAAFVFGYAVFLRGARTFAKEV